MCTICRDYGELINGNEMGNLYSRYAHCHLSRSIRHD
jgi:hypothetical protein